MCGIAGQISFDRPPHAEPAMLEAIAHRGPDDHGIYHDDTAFLGFRRLAIVDLSPAGHQPMCNEDRTIWLVFNGEIYNYRDLTAELRGHGHRFRSQTDSETIIHAYEQWGTACLQRFNGMFAFVLWDARRRRCLCARDRFGVKPLYYARSGSGLIFASEIKAILRHPCAPRRAANTARIFDFLAAGLTDHSEETCFAGILQVPAAHYLLASPDGIGAHRYWDLPDDPHFAPVPVSRAQRRTWAEECRALLEDSVRLRLHADVPVGTCLSGGLDSSSIVCLANRLLFAGAEPLPWHRRGGRQKTFSACYDDQRHDERRYIEMVLAATGAQANYTYPGRDSALESIIPRVVWHQDEPFGSTSILAQWHVMEAARRQGVTVLLDGQGADELLAGYHGYFGAALADDVLSGHAAQLARDVLCFRRYHAPSWGSIARSTANALLPPGSAERRRLRALVPSIRHPTGWLDPDFARHHALTLLWPERQAGRLGTLLYTQATRTSLPALLRYEDRNSMAFSIEARTPFLDYRLAEFLFRLPNAAHLQHGITKVVLRDAMRGILPEPVRSRLDKKGFSTPEDVWFRTSLRDWALEILRSPSLAARGWINQCEVLRIFERHLAGQANESVFIWRIVNVELWARLFLDSQTVAP